MSFTLAEKVCLCHQIIQKKIQMKVKHELPIKGTEEQDFAAALSLLPKVVDCRLHANLIRQLAISCGVNMVVGCGGSHIYIHRKHQFIEGQHTHAENERWAIITD